MQFQNRIRLAGAGPQGSPGTGNTGVSRCSNPGHPSRFLGFETTSRLPLRLYANSEMDSESIIELRRVSRRFDTQLVLRDVNLQVRRGETLAIIGESGCGKSVTLKLMTALLTPTAGDVVWFGRPIVHVPERELAKLRLRFGYLFQGAALFDSMSVYENVAFGLRENRKLSENAIRDNVQQRLQEIGLDESICDRKPAELSGGMRKRVGLARALALEPEIVLYDEPTTGLDPVMSDVINELILRVRSLRPVTSIVVTHDMRTVDRVSDRVVMLSPLSRLEPDDSQIIFDGTTEELFAAADPRVNCFVRGDTADRSVETTITQSA